MIAATLDGALELAGLSARAPRLQVLLPVGISFYIFQALGYTVDVYRGDVRATRHFGKYALFVSFFPQLVAGRSSVPVGFCTSLTKFTAQTLKPCGRVRFKFCWG